MVHACHHPSESLHPSTGETEFMSALGLNRAPKHLVKSKHDPKSSKSSVQDRKNLRLSRAFTMNVWESRCVTMDHFNCYNYITNVILACALNWTGLVIPLNKHVPMWHTPTCDLLLLWNTTVKGLLCLQQKSGTSKYGVQKWSRVKLLICDVH